MCAFYLICLSLVMLLFWWCYTVDVDYGPFPDNKSMNECRNHTEDHNDEYLQDLVHKLTTNAKHLKIAHLNVRGLRKKVDELRILLKLCRFDVFGVTETHLNSEIIDGEIDIEDYNLIRRDRPGRQLRRGLCDILSHVAESNPPTWLGRWTSGRDMYVSKGWLKRHPGRNYIPATKPKQWILHSVSKINGEYPDKILRYSTPWRF